MSDYLTSLHALPERTQIAIDMKLNGFTLKQIGAEIGVSRERARQIIVLGMRKLTAN